MNCITGAMARVTDARVFIIPEEDGVGGDDESIEIGTNGSGDGSGWASGAGAGEFVIGSGELSDSSVFGGVAFGSEDSSTGAGGGVWGEGDGTGGGEGDATGDGSTGTLGGGDGVAVPAGAHAAIPMMTYLILIRYSHAS